MRHWPLSPLLHMILTLELVLLFSAVVLFAEDVQQEPRTNDWLITAIDGHYAEIASEKSKDFPENQQLEESAALRASYSQARAKAQLRSALLRETPSRAAASAWVWPAKQRSLTNSAACGSTASSFDKAS